MPRSPLSLALLAAMLLPGCRNSCQTLCSKMADFATECGYDWTKEDVKACISDHSRADVDRNTRQSCAQYSSDISLEWTCEDLAPYFNADPAEPGGRSAQGDTG